METEQTTIIQESYPEIDLTVIYEYLPHWTDFKAYEIIGHEQGDNNKFDVPMYEMKGAKSSDETTKNIEEAQTLISGVVKWDGCSHYTFGDKDGYIHLCGNQSIKNIIQAIKKIYNRSGELMERKDIDEFPILSLNQE